MFLTYFIQGGDTAFFVGEYVAVFDPLDGSKNIVALDKNYYGAKYRDMTLV
jgi:fructose-1,6-bisphosphatase